MSLIQDALKRQQEESESRRLTLKTAPVLSVPDAMPVSPSPPAMLCEAPRAGPQPKAPSVDPEKPGKSGKSWKQIAGIIIFCILVVWGVGLLVVVVMKQSAERALLGAFMPDLTKAHVTLGKPAIKAPPPPVHPSAVAGLNSAVIPPSARSSASIPLISAAAAAAPAFADEGEDVEDVTLPSVNEQELATAASTPVSVPVVWPSLKLTAIFSKVGSGQAGARLNNRLILLGDQIEGVTLVEIRQNSVVLKFGAETRFLKMGATLN